MLAAAVFNFDLTNLRNQNAIFTKAYDIIKIQEAWKKIQNSNPVLSGVKIGIIDVDGIDVNHQEFKGEVINGALVGNVDFGNTPLSARIDEGGHGTAVVGIIGANNISFFKTLETNSPQMSGILSGASPQLSYSFEVRKIPSFALLFDQLKAIFQSKLSGSDVINLSIGTVKRSALSQEQIDSRFIDGQANALEFFRDTQIFKLMFNSAPDTLFIVSAGNHKVDASNAAPANLGNLSNVITAGATDLEEERAKFNDFQESNFGNTVTITAPGKNVYVPKPGNDYDKPSEFLGIISGGFSGTSASAPMVTGVAGLLKALEPEYQKHITGLLMSPEKIKEVLVKSADPIQTGETNKRLGSGCYNETTTSTGCRLNAHRAVAWLLPPKPVENLATSNITSSSITLNWTKTSDFDFQNPDFDSYHIFRSTSPNVTTNNILVSTITNSNQVSFTDTNLTPNTAFFYKVFVFDKANLSTPGNEISATTSGISQPSGTWQSVGPMTVARADHTTTLLNDGRVLIAGGFNMDTDFAVLASAEIFNPTTNTFTSISNMTTLRTSYAATLLSDGRVLITGGSSNTAILNSTEIFDPVTNTFSPANNLNSKRFSHTADILPDGRVLIAGGFGGLDSKSTEIFNPQTGTFSPGPDMSAPRGHHVSTRLNDGRILFVNGLNTGSIMSVDIYNPFTNTFTLATSSAETLGLSVNTLPNGKVLILGGKIFNQPSGLAAEIFNPADNSFVEIGPMLRTGAARNSSVLLNDGKVLFVGTASIRSQIFSPETNVFSLTTELNIPRFFRHQLTLLQDGRVLLTGGQLLGSVIISDAEVFKP